MLPSVKNWPMWLCIATLLLAAVASVVSYNYRNSAAKLSMQRDAFNQSKAEYDKRIADLGAKTTLHTAGDTGDIVKIPKMAITCTGLFSCVPKTDFEELNLARAVQGPDVAVKRELDKHRAQVATLSKQVAATGEETKSLEQIDHMIRTVMAPLIGVLVLLASLYVILSGGYRTDGEKWAFGSIGTIIGFWLKV